MIEIVDLVDHPRHVDTLLSWLVREWPNATRDRAARKDRLCGDFKKDRLPINLIAVEKGNLVGFISLILHDVSAEVGRPFWIDAIVIDPQSRRRGVARELLTAIEEVAARLKISPLYALTDVPELYYKNNWIYLESSKRDPAKDVVVTKNLLEPILHN